MGDGLICDIVAVGATAHYVHLGLAGMVSLGGTFFLGLGVRAHRRSRRARAVTVAEARSLPTLPSPRRPSAG